MLQILITLKCDDCGKFFEELRSSSKADLQEWAMNAGELDDTADLAGWFFNAKTRKHWCIDCAAESNSPRQLLDQKELNRTC